MNRPRGAKVGGRADVGRLRELVQGDTVLVRDAFGAEHRRTAMSGVVWGMDFAVVWVARPECVVPAAGGTITTRGRGEAVPWPAEDVRRVPPGGATEGAPAR